MHDRFQEWEQVGFFRALWQAGLQSYDELIGIQWEWQAIDGANRHDMKLLCAMLDGIVIARPQPTESQPQHLCMDAGYDDPVSRQGVEDHQYVPHMRSRGADKQKKVLTPGYRARRWVVERTLSWINRSRRLLVRWEKKGENYLAFLHLAFAQLTFAKALVFGYALRAASLQMQQKLCHNSTSCFRLEQGKLSL